MVRLNKSETKIFNIIKAELRPVATTDILLKVSYAKNTIMHVLSTLERRKLIWGFRRFGTTYYLEGNPDYE